MPFYEYQCSACNFYVEALQKISEEPLRKCPSCKKQTLKRLISAPVFRLKGGGWYETDFKSDKEEKRNLAGREEGAEAKVEEGKKDTAADTAKPAEAKASDAKPEKPKTESAPSASGSKRTVVSSRAAQPAAKARKPSKPKKAPARKKSSRR